MLVAVCVFASGACSTLGLDTPRVDGEWLFSARNISDGSTLCTISGLQLVLAQDGERVSGTAQSGSIVCSTADDETISTSMATEPIVNGSVNGDDEIVFDIGNADWHHEGVVESNSMTGTVTVRFGGTLGTSRFTGSFGATRVTVPE